MVVSNCAVRSSKKSRLIKEQEASVLLTSLRIKTPFDDHSPAGERARTK